MKRGKFWVIPLWNMFNHQSCIKKDMNHIILCWFYSSVIAQAPHVWSQASGSEKNKYFTEKTSPQGFCCHSDGVEPRDFKKFDIKPPLFDTWKEPIKSENNKFNPLHTKTDKPERRCHFAISMDIGKQNTEKRGIFITNRIISLTILLWLKIN